MLRMKRAVIFDLYGVLALNGWQNFKNTHFANRGSSWHAAYKKLGDRVDAGQVTYEEFVDFIADQSGESESVVRHQLEHCVPNTELLEYVQSALYGQYKLGILSNGGSQSVVDDVMPNEQSLFDVIVFSREEGVVKPHPEIYRIMADRLGVAPENCVFIDDQLSHVEGARTAGMTAVIFTNVTELKQELSKVL